MLSYTEQLAYKIYKLVYRDKVKKFTWKKTFLSHIENTILIRKRLGICAQFNFGDTSVQLFHNININNMHDKNTE